MYVSVYVYTNIKSLFFLQNVANPAAQILCTAMPLRDSCSSCLYTCIYICMYVYM